MGDKKLSSSGNADPDQNPATQKVTALKEEGNVAFKAGDTDAAIHAYTKGNEYLNTQSDISTLDLFLLIRCLIITRYPNLFLKLVCSYSSM